MAQELAIWYNLLTVYMVISKWVGPVTCIFFFKKYSQKLYVDLQLSRGVGTPNPQSSHILFPIHTIPLLSLHLINFAHSLWIWWLLLHFFNFISRSSLFWYVKSLILLFPSPTLFFLPLPLSFFHFKLK